MRTVAALLIALLPTNLTHEPEMGLQENGLMDAMLDQLHRKYR